MKEYYKRPDATAEFFWKDEVGNEWGSTGDVGYVDEDGFVFVQGRASDFFVNKSGEHVYCFDVEVSVLDAFNSWEQLNDKEIKHVIDPDTDELLDSINKHQSSYRGDPVCEYFLRKRAEGKHYRVAIY